MEINFLGNLGIAQKVEDAFCVVGCLRRAGGENAWRAALGSLGYLGSAQKIATLPTSIYTLLTYSNKYLKTVIYLSNT
jgi:hypothetical protein